MYVTSSNSQRAESHGKGAYIKLKKMFKNFNLAFYIWDRDDIKIVEVINNFDMMNWGFFAIVLSCTHYSLARPLKFTNFFTKRGIAGFTEAERQQPFYSDLNYSPRPFQITVVDKESDNLITNLHLFPTDENSNEYSLSENRIDDTAVELPEGEQAEEEQPEVEQPEGEQPEGEQPEGEQPEGE